jgi:hypothetical protein
MNRRVVITAVTVCLIAAMIVVLKVNVFNAATPHLSFVCFTNSPGGSSNVAILRFDNRSRHKVYLTGLTNGSPFFARELALAGGWLPIDMLAPRTNDSTWDVGPDQTCVFFVPSVTNEQIDWRVTIRYFDGEETVKLPLLPPFKAPGSGSGEYLKVSTEPITPRR